MTLWLILGAMCAVVAAGLLFGLRPARDRPPDRAEHGLAVYRAQLEELERDLARGVIDPGEYDSARLEIERRLLAADAARGDAARGDAAREDAAWTEAGRGTLAWALGIVLLVPVGAVALYLWLGNPGIESRPLAERRAAPAEAGASPSAADVEAMVARLRARLAGDPSDLEGWTMLGRSAAVLGRYDEAADAYERVLARDPSRAEVYSALGEVRLLAAEGIITQAAQQAFNRALEIDPGDPRARFYLALARDQDGDKEGALEALLVLLAEAPADAPWADRVHAAAAELAGQLGRDPVALRPPPRAAGPDQTAAPGAAEAGAADQADMIRTMVAGLAERLAASPDDAEGWRMLGRSYQVLGEAARAAEAYGRLAELLPDDTEAQLAYAAALIDAAAPGASAPPRAVAILGALNDKDPAQPDVLYYLGEAARRDGAPEAAARHWRRLLDQLAQGSEEYDWLKARIDALSAPD